MEQEVTVCTNCVHFINLEPESPRRDTWYNHLCRANLLPVRIDPYDGKSKPVGTNDLGVIYFSNEPYKYCRDCNDGNCPDFEPKEGPKKEELGDKHRKKSIKLNSKDVEFLAQSGIESF